MKIRAIIVDDELPARKGLLKMLQSGMDVEVVEECRDGFAAIASIAAVKPDVVFLDIQMPGMSGFEVLKNLDPEHIPFIIFVTAFNQYAIDAFEIHALDYLLKPIALDRLKTAVDHARQRLASIQPKDDLQSRMGEFLAHLQEEKKDIERLLTREREQNHRPDRIAVKTTNNISLVRIDQIDWIEAAGDYAKIHARATVYLVRESMSALETKLDESQFIRIHRSTIVNIDRIAELKPLFAGDYLVVLQDGTKLTLTRNRRAKLEKYFHKLS